MVFESLVADLLNKYLGEYVENLDKSQLNIGIWGGDVALRDLTLKENALEDLNLPVKTVRGHLGQLTLQIPWKNLYGAPVIATIERLFLLVVPNQSVRYDKEKEEKWAEEAKQAELLKIEEAKKALREKDKPKPDNTFVEKLAAQIIKNVQVRIKNIHIRYEDKVTNPEKPFALGITLNSLDVVTIPSWGEPLSIDPVNIIFKELSIQCLSVYWNSCTTLFSDFSTENYLIAISDGIATKSTMPPGYKYMLGPINSSSKLRINTKPEMDGSNFKIPKVLLQLDLERLQVKISKSQYQDLTVLLETMSRMSRAAQYRKFRPDVSSYRGHYKEWWIFAYKCILEEEVKRRKQNWDWFHMLNHRLLCKKYAETYKGKLISPKPSSEIIDKCTQLERELDILNIVLVRQKVELEVEREVKHDDQVRKENRGGWFSGWWGSGSKAESPEIETPIVQQFEKAMTKDEKDKLYRAIGYQEGAPVTVYPESFIEVDVGITLHSLELEIVNDERKVSRVLVAAFSEVTSRFQQRPSAQALMVNTSIERFSVFGCQQGDVTPQLVLTKKNKIVDVSDDTGGHLFRALFETKPIDKKCDQRLHIFSSPLQVVYDAFTINSVVEVFTTKQQAVVQQLQAAASMKLAEITEKSASGLQHMIQQHGIFDLNVDMSASHVLIPKNGFYVENENPMVVINLGRIQIVSKPRGSVKNVKELHTQGTSSDQILQEMRSRSYDNFSIQLSDLQILFAQPGEYWEENGDVSNSQMYILKPTTIIIELAKCIITDDPRLPKIKVKGHLPSVTFSVAEKRLQGLISLLLSIPLPEPQEPEEELKVTRYGSMTSLHSINRVMSGIPSAKKSSAAEQGQPSALAPDDELIQFKELEIMFELEDLSLYLLVEDDVSGDLKPLMEFHMLKLEAEMSQQTFDLNIILRLGGLSLKQLYVSQDIQLVNTPMASGRSDYLFTVTYSNVNKNSPEFHTKHQSVLQLIEINFSKLDIFIHLEAMLNLINWSNRLNKFLEDAQAEKKQTIDKISAFKAKPIMAVIKEESTVLVKTVKSKPMTRVEVIDLRVRTKIGEIKVGLGAESCGELCSLGVSGVDAGVIMKKSYTQVDVKLKDVNLLDLSNSTGYKQILSLVNQEEALVANIVIFTEEGKATSRVDMSVKASMACMRFVFLNRFITSLLDFMNNFQAAQETLIEASQAAAEAAKQNVQDAYAKAFRIQLDINLKAPIILVPEHSNSYEGMMLDLGHLTIQNTLFDIYTKDSEDPAVLDRLQIDLQKLKLARIQVDDLLQVASENSILENISFKVTVQRNLSSGWFTDAPDIEIGGRLQSIHIKISQEDYVLMMSILEQNLGEKTDALLVYENSIETNSQSHLYSTNQEPVFTEKSANVVLEHAEKLKTTMKFTLTLDSVIIDLLSNQANNGEVEGLAKFTLYVISVKGSMLSDGSLQTSLLLLDCMLDDTRPSQHNKITRYMERKKDRRLSVDSNLKEESDRKSMIDITYQQKNDNMFVDVRVCSFNLILNLQLLLKIGAFFTVPSSVPQSVHKTKVQRPERALTPTKTIEEQAKVITINLKLEHPDIILVENLDDINTSALLLHTELTFKMRVAGKLQTMTGSVNDLQLFSCCYNPHKRKQTKAPVLRPVTIALTGSTPEDSGLHIDLSTTNIQLSVSPDIIKLLSGVYMAVSSTSQQTQNEFVCDMNRSDMWNMETYSDTDFSFLKTEIGEEAISDEPPRINLPENMQQMSEICIFSAPSIILTIEVGVGKTTVPMLLLQSSIQATVKDWSSQLSVDSHVCLEVAYYNNTLALWEPLIEPVETTKGGKTSLLPWELSLQVETSPPVDDSMSDVLMSSMVSDTSATTPKSLMTINITSKEILPISVTKTCLDVLKQLGASFTDAIYKPTEQMMQQMPQFILKNDTGLSITLLLNDSDFKLFSSGGVATSSHSLTSTSENEISEVVLASNAKVELSATYEHKLGLQSSAVDKYISIQVPEYDCKLELPVMRADKRFFLLNHRGAGNDPWGLVSDIKVSNGCTTITLRSIIQVINHFTVPVSVYFMTKKGNELMLIGTVEPNEYINLPLHSIYTPTNELFFSVEGYTVSVVPYIWKDLQKTLEKTTLMQCNPKNIEDKEPFFIKAIGEIEQVYFELSNRHTMSSTCYNIHIRPTVILKNLLPVDIICCIQGIAADKLVKSGEHIQVPTAEPGSSSIVIRIIGYLDREWCCKHEISAITSAPLSVWTFECYENPVRTTLDLGMHTLDRNGSLIMALYCPFWMINKTGLILSYRQSDEANNVLYHPADYKGPIMFSFKAKTFFAKKKSCIRIENGSWSEKFSLDVAGSSGVVQCKTNNKIYQIGVNIQLTYNTLTKQVMFTPYHVLINNCPLAIECKEVSVYDNTWIKVEPNGCMPFWPMEKDESGALIVRFDGTEETSIPFYFHKVHNTLLKLANKYGALNVDVQVTEGAVYISLYSYEPGMAPALLINHTDIAIDYYDKARKDSVKVLYPSNKVLFCWESVEEHHTLAWLNGKHTNHLREDGIGDFSNGKDRKYYWVSFLYGLQRVLLFTDVPSIARDAQNIGENEVFTQEIEMSIHGIGLSLVDNISKVEVLYVGITSSGIVWETKKASKKRYKTLSSRDSELIETAYNHYVQKLAVGDRVDPKVTLDNRIVVDFEEQQMLKPSNKQLRRTYNTGLWLHICSSVHQYQLHAKINRIQIDNQMFDCVFPVVLSPVPPPRSISADSTPKPFIEVSIVKRINDYSAVQQYKYFKILIQEFHIKVDIGFINALVKLFEAGEISEEDEKNYFIKDRALVNEPLLSHVTFSSSQEQKNFYDILHLSPLKIHVSFSLSGGSGHPSGSQSEGQQDVAGGGGTPPFLNVLMQSFGVTLTDIQDVILKLSYFERQYSFLTQRQLLSEAQSHYVGQLVKQLYVLVFGLDVLGNPYGLVLGFTQGAADLFYEPFQGAIQGPGEFAEGLVLGVRSLFGHTVGGAAGAVSRITGAMGKGLAALTFDKEYQRHRRETLNKRPANMQEGLARSGKGLVMGVVEGIGGVITKPISGAKDEGVQGFFKGVGKGVVGLVTRPTAGIVDFAAGSFNAVKRATDMSEEVTRMRVPRHFKADGLVRPYSKLEAEGNKLLLDLEKGRFTLTDTYVFHMPMGSAKQKDMLLLTDQRIAYLSHNEIFGGYQMDWSYTWQDMAEPPRVIENGVVLVTSDKKKGVRGFFLQSDTGKVLLIQDAEMRKFIVDTITELMQKVKNPRVSVSPSHR